MCILPFHALRMFLAVQNYVACFCRVTLVCEEYTEPSQTMLGLEIHFYVPYGVTLFHIWESRAVYSRWCGWQNAHILHLKVCCLLKNGSLFFLCLQLIFLSLLKMQMTASFLLLDIGLVLGQVPWLNTCKCSCHWIVYICIKCLLFWWVHDETLNW
jgi:hypothetical protein